MKTNFVSHPLYGIFQILCGYHCYTFMLTAMILGVAVIQQWECLSYTLQGSCHGLTGMEYAKTMVRGIVEKSIIVMRLGNIFIRSFVFGLGFTMKQICWDCIFFCIDNLGA